VSLDSLCALDEVVRCAYSAPSMHGMKKEGGEGGQGGGGQCRIEVKICRRGDPRIEAREVAGQCARAPAGGRVKVGVVWAGKAGGQARCSLVAGCWPKFARLAEARPQSCPILATSTPWQMPKQKFRNPSSS
jgi:hypothetical protein